ncbi:hypothetical protein Cgig2_009581 [Carnegiea gigantea]|uniref:PGG domain-containing protein n=1 Tax=Carnegiea gigantea TaxID=171969 RepID=A0A9Q1KBD8_9CARY|nr:hypothetical protein Cgig2_009581 [Carnegiea gigantea]
MDRLFQIAQIGDVEKLRQLLEEKPLILHQVPLMCAENPLHFSLAAGHLDFAREIVQLKPEFATGLNPEGYSCLHLASANGYVDIVQEIISVDPMLCRVKGRGGRTPFHVAGRTGRVDLIKEMLSSCEGCIEDVTVQKETAFHLAVRNYQFESLQVMLDWIRQMKKEDILNKKDEHDLLLIFPSEAGDREKGAGALRAQDLALHITTHSSSARGSLASQGVCNLVEYFSFHDGRDSPGEVRGTLLVIAVLVATATYQVGINPPCGVWQDDSQGQVAGISIMGSQNMVSYVLLVAFNSIGSTALGFVKEIVKLKPEFARELHPEGFSLMHVASANGHVEIVREIIRVDPRFVLSKKERGRLPFHFAVLTERVDLIQEVLANCEQCIEDVTVQKETALHLAIRNCQFGGLTIMLDWIRQMNKEDILNKKDEHGNTRLCVSSNEEDEHGNMVLGRWSKSALRNFVEYFKFHDGRDSPSDVRSTLLVRAVSVATATYQVGINTPAGLWQDDSQGHVAGTSIMSTHKICPISC